MPSDRLKNDPSNIGWASWCLGFAYSGIQPTTAKIESGGINTLDRRAAKCRYQHAEPSLATPLDALTQQPRPLTHETLQRYSSLHCALVLGYNRVSPESCKQAPGPPLVCPGLPV